MLVFFWFLVVAVSAAIFGATSFAFDFFGWRPFGAPPWAMGLLFVNVGAIGWFATSLGASEQSIDEKFNRLLRRDGVDRLDDD